MELLNRAKKAINVFLNKDPTEDFSPSVGYSNSYSPSKPTRSFVNRKTLASSLYNRIAMDVASVDIRHVKLGEDYSYSEDIRSSLSDCLTLEANKDQTARAFFQDIVISMFDEGVVAVVPIDTSSSIYGQSTFDIYTMRTGRIIEWKPNHVRVDVYNDKTGLREDIIVPKHSVAIIENPLYSVVNEPNSTMKRLLRKLAILDAIDEQSGSGKLDLIIQLPYMIKSEARKKQAEERRQAIEDQLSGSKYGIAYTDGTERIVQLNRAIENNLMGQIEYLTNQLYGELGLTAEILNGTANEQTLLNYNNRTVEPIISAITDEFKRKFLTKTARTQGQTITFFRDPFKLVPVAQLAEIADKFTRNEILTPNEIRRIVGRKPSGDANSDVLKNRNIAINEQELLQNPNKEKNQNEV